MTEPIPLDPDEVTCPRCEAGPSVPCRTPGGGKARKIHLERRRAADAGGTEHDRAATEPRKTRRAKPRPGQTPPPADRESRAKGGRKAAQDRRRRRAEQEAALEAETERRLREEAEANAARLAADAVRFAEDRAILKRQTLDAARRSAERLLESLEHLRRPRGFDEHGKPVQLVEEVYVTKDGVRRRAVDADGTPTTREVDDVVGWYGPDTVERLAKVAASTLNSLRLEEGKPTGIHRNEGGGTSEILGEAGVSELLEWASENLPRSES